MFGPRANNSKAGVHLLIFSIFILTCHIYESINITVIIFVVAPLVLIGIISITIIIFIFVVLVLVTLAHNFVNIIAIVAGAFVTFS